jgi:hypothetical protein
MSESTLLKNLFANRLSDHNLVASQLHTVLDSLESHLLIEYVCAGECQCVGEPRHLSRQHCHLCIDENVKVFNVWRQKLHGLLVSTIVGARWSGLGLLTTSIRKCERERLSGVVDEWSAYALTMLNVSCDVVCVDTSMITLKLEMPDSPT